jgi:1-phosphofructokinase family hexose kinase
VTLVICPNLAVDRMLVTDAVRPGGLSRCRELRTQAGGKGANVARATHALGGEATLVGFAAGRMGRSIVELAHEEGLELHTVQSAGETRASTVVLEDDGSVTRLYETGPRVAAAEESALAALVGGRHQAAPGEWAVITGAAPPGVSPKFYATLLAAARSRGYRVLVDATGEQLAAALDGRPELVKVNLAEACSVVGGPGVQCDEQAAGRDLLVEEAGALARRLCRAGAGAALLTLGAAGAAGVLDGAAWEVATPAVHAVNPVGSGDCFAAALALALQRGEGAAEALRLAAGAGAANATSAYNGDVDPALARKLAGEATAGLLADA